MDSHNYNPKKIGEILEESGLVTSEQIEEAITASKIKGTRLGETLVYLGFVTEADIAHTLSMQLHIPHLDLETINPHQDAIDMLSQGLANKFQVIPISIDQTSITVAMADPLNFEAIQDIGFATGLKVKPAVATVSKIKEAIPSYYNLNIPVQEILNKMSGGKVEILEDEDRTNALNVEEITEKSGSPPVIRVVNSIIFDAVGDRASDIHIEPREDTVIVRERVDGLLQDVLHLPKWINGAVVSRIKIMSNLDISERRIPQDGRIKIRVKGREIDLRISVLPIQYGEKVVIRILDTATTLLSLNDIGLLERDHARVKLLIERPQGIILLTGPTGSGKSSSLYAMIMNIKTDLINIISLEDPIEYELDGVNQVAINEKTGMTFSYGLRSVLRQDPDVVMVGEMRDSETANIAVQASLTGHLVFSTLHTNTAIAVITRLRNMGVQPYLIASSLNGIIAQRLVRVLCNQCKESYTPSADELSKLGLKLDNVTSLEFHRGVGCTHCNKTGYKGRTGVFEILVTTPQMRELIANDVDEDTLVKAALEGGMKHMSEDGIEKVKLGITSFEELLRVIYIGEEEEIFVCSCCNATIRPDFLTCPYCGESVLFKCPNCSKPRDPDWKFCAYCRHEFDEKYNSCTTKTPENPGTKEETSKNKTNSSVDLD